LFERLSIFFSPDDLNLRQSEMDSAQKRYFIPTQLLVQTAPKFEKLDKSILQLWIVKKEGNRQVDWAGAFGQSYFVYAQGYLSVCEESRHPGY
jgi:hypothetical protein